MKKKSKLKCTPLLLFPDHIPFYTSVMHEMHNKYRHAHGMPAVILDKEVSGMLDSYALHAMRISYRFYLFIRYSGLHFYTYQITPTVI